MSRNIKTREGYEFWDRLNAIPHYGFLLNQQGNGVIRAEGIGDWIERHPAQVIVDDAQTEVNVLREENAKLQAEVTALSKNVVEFTREDFDATLNNLRRMGASIDGDNAYKRDLCDLIVGALAQGAQNWNPPPAGHWGQRFWDIGREERQLHEELVAALKLTRENLRACQGTIHLAGGFDPAYVEEAQAAMAVADAALAKASA
ncbi:hypothetical protein [Pseudomonas fluorescens]|uniref:hypothetical protein n=1 Tax=Pseudomonas fluorescens TaxID=294 RepID=UPI000A6181AE|nr:hypothetical protein [Pseudomonas fluorescens]